MKEYCKQAGVSLKIATHGLRHSTSELYMEHGASRDDINALFNHSSNEVTERYIHDKSRRRQSISKIADNIVLFPVGADHFEKKSEIAPDHF